MYTFKGRRIFRFISENGKKPWKNAMNDVIKAQKHRNTTLPIRLRPILFTSNEILVL